MGTNSRTTHQSYVLAPTAPAPPAEPVPGDTPAAEQLDLVPAQATSEANVEQPPPEPTPDAAVGLARCPHCGQFVGMADHDCPIWLARNRDYRNEHGRITCAPIGLLQEHLALGDEPVMVRLNGHIQVSGDAVGHQVHGSVPVYGPEMPFDPTTATEHLQCSCGQPNCAHAQLAAAELIDRLRSPSIRTPDRRTTDAVLSQLSTEHQESVAAQEASASSPPAREGSYVDDAEAFQAAYTAARQRMSHGQPAVPYQMENATGGLGARGTGRGFGVELEFDLPRGRDSEATLAAIAEDMNRARISQHRSMVGYHAGRVNGYSDARDAWRLERDTTVSGEIVSPILYDTPETWRDLATVCDIIRRHGGTARSGPAATSTCPRTTTTTPWRTTTGLSAWWTVIPTRYSGSRPIPAGGATAAPHGAPPTRCPPTGTAALNRFARTTAATTWPSTCRRSPDGPATTWSSGCGTPASTRPSSNPKSWSALA
jgi:hypothetical protein